MLSKSQYTRGVRCEKSLWLLKHGSGSRTPPDASAQTRFRHGIAVGNAAKGLFPGGLEIHFDPEDFPGMARQTSALIDQGVCTIYEATFFDSDGGRFARADIIHRDAENSAWDIYEVKSSTSVKPYHLDDAAFQWSLLSGELDLNRIYIAHINNAYVREGGLQLEQLFTLVDVTSEVMERQSFVQDRVNSFRKMIELEEPRVDIGDHCSAPYDCDFINHCWAHIPTPSVFNLYRLAAGKKFDLYEQGVITYDQLPSDLALNATQSRQVRTSSTKQPEVQPELLWEFLGSIKIPVSYFDFETIMEPIPQFDNQRPYDQIPFQYSLHVETESGEVSHKEYLADAEGDPRSELALRMLADFPNEGSIIAFNIGFERARIRELAALLPELSDRLTALNARFVDLVKPFRDGGYYHPDFLGSFSLKSILPAMFPDDTELRYQGLSVSEGSEAMEAFASLQQVTDPTEKEKIRDDLLAYCKLDTLAMVKIMQRLRELAS